MPIDFTCPHCGKHTNVADQYAGTSGPCAACGQTVTVPGKDFPYGKMSPAPIPPRAASSGPWGTVLIVLAASVIPLLACGGILLALLLPAIQAAREAARRTQCNNNIKNISLALQNYHDTYKTFPAGAWHAGVAGESDRLGPSWWFGILPFCEQRNIYDQIMRQQMDGPSEYMAFNADSLNTGIAGQPLTMLVPEYMRCPSSPLPVSEQVSGPVCLPTYVGVSGGCDISMASPDYAGIPGQTGPMATRDYLNRRKGAGHTPGGILTVSGMLPACEQVSMASCTDGTSNTMIVGEQSDWLMSVDRNVGTKFHGDPGWDTSGTGSGGGFISGTAQTFKVPMAVNGLPGASPTPYDCYNLTTVRYRPDDKRVLGVSPLPGCDEDHGINNPLQSPHPGGLLIGLVDGSVQFVSGTTDLAILLRLAIRDDGQNVSLY